SRRRLAPARFRGALAHGGRPRAAAQAREPEPPTRRALLAGSRIHRARLPRVPAPARGTRASRHGRDPRRGRAADARHRRGARSPVLAARRPRSHPPAAARRALRGAGRDPLRAARISGARERARRALPGRNPAAERGGDGRGPISCRLTEAGPGGTLARMKRVVVVDNYDSFTYNLVQYVMSLGIECDVRLNDKTTSAEIGASKPDGILLSPGPGTPDDAGVTLDVIREQAGKIPIFGVCLGHQSIGQAFGGTVLRAPLLMHGKT